MKNINSSKISDRLNKIARKLRDINNKVETEALSAGSTREQIISILEELQLLQPEEGGSFEQQEAIRMLRNSVRKIEIWLDEGEKMRGVKTFVKRKAATVFRPQGRW
ncbi:hypothetical protein KKF38_04775 [Patescibacteria group bacterium]|nr:hypothetical protein [Patescibacteria group bacterium]